MTDITDARDDAIAALAEYGKPLAVTRPAEGYNPALRRRVTGAPLVQTLQGLMTSPPRGNSRYSTSETVKFERGVILSPDKMTFEPQIGDLITAEGRQWRIDGALNITRAEDLVIIIEAGLVGA